MSVSSVIYWFTLLTLNSTRTTQRYINEPYEMVDEAVSQSPKEIMIKSVRMWRHE